MNWFSAGSHWTHLAAAGKFFLTIGSTAQVFVSGSLYLIMLIAQKEGMAAHLKAKTTSSTVLIALGNLIRAPSDSGKLPLTSKYFVNDVTSKQSLPLCKTA